ncbi:hypothetical protein [Phyllobacterium sp. K27]
MAVLNNICEINIVIVSISMDIVKRILGLLLVLIALSSCLTPPSVVNDVHMNDKTAYGSVATAYYAVFSFLQVQPFYSTKVGYGFKTVYAAFERVNFEEAWSFGKQLEFTKGSFARQPCFQAPCMVFSNGIVTLSEAEFLAASSNGFAFELVGKSGKVVGKVGPQAFRYALKLKSKLGPHASPSVNRSAETVVIGEGDKSGVDL